MKINPNFMLKEIAGDYLVVTVGEGVVDLSDSFTLTESGAFLWKELINDVTEQELVTALLSEYDVDEETANCDVKEFLADLSARNMLL
ncbi:MAG: PqqD family protein [Clostridia bacterium]|nr:PqqD family protein [Clostridia bacterium]